MVSRLLRWRSALRQCLQLRFDCNSTAIRPHDDLRHDRAAALWPTQAVRVATQYAPPLSFRRRAPPSRRNVAVLSHADYVPTLTAAAALRVKAVLSKAAWLP